MCIEQTRKCNGAFISKSSLQNKMNKFNETGKNKRKKQEERNETKKKSRSQKEGNKYLRAKGTITYEMKSQAG